MPIRCIDSYLVQPGKGIPDLPEIVGTRVPNSGKLFGMLERVYDRAEKECQIGISFVPRDGQQENDCRDLLLTYMRRPRNRAGEIIAERLRGCTGGRSGIGLLFLMYGEEHNHHRLVISRFPADEGVLAEPQGRQLSIAFVERVFMKSTKAYKSVLYKAPTLAAGFWRGRAVDRQINGPRETANYWIEDFLGSSLSVQGAAGSKRLANALRLAISQAPLEAKEEMIAAVRLLRNQGGRRASARQFMEGVGLSGEAIGLVERQVSSPELFAERFQFDADEFAIHTPLRSVELSNGAMLTAETGKFDQVFRQRRVAEDAVEYTTEGKMVNDRIRRRV